ncbi:Protein R02F11.1 [Aphelenchoides avenae]|nr:Protein R02F11.1 [Aphelenchus avenae]
MELTRFQQALLFGTIAALFISVNISGAQENPDTPDSPESSLDDDHAANDSALVSRVKRQWGCPSGCFSSCMNNAQCQRYQVATVCVLGCCCQQQNLSTACDGDPAVAACLNGLCGQGYFCNNRNYCCRCQSGTSPELMLSS